MAKSKVASGVLMSDLATMRIAGDLMRRADDVLANATDIMATFKAALQPLSGKVDDVAVEKWAKCSDAFKSGYIGKGIQGEDDDRAQQAAQKAWQRLVEGVFGESLRKVKPQSVAAAAKAAQRARNKEKAPSKAVVTNVVETVTVEKPVATVAPKADKMMAESARVTACLELLRAFNQETLIKAHAALLKMAERAKADATM